KGNVVMVGAAARRRQRLNTYSALLMRWALLLLGCTFAAAATGYLVAKHRPATYTAAALLTVNVHETGSDANAELLASDQLVQTYMNLIKSTTVLEPAARSEGSISAQQLATEVSVSNPGISTQLLQVQVTDRSPARAARLADGVATSLIQVQQQMSAQ